MIKMAKVKGALFSFDARGTIADSITYSIWRGVQYVRQWFSPQNPKTPAQLNIRGFFAEAVDNWRTVLTAEQKNAWIEFASGMAMSGFNAYVGRYIKAKLDNEEPPVLP